MRSRRLLWRMYGVFFAATLAALIAVTWHASLAFRDFYRSQTDQTLQMRAALIAHTVRRDRLTEDAARAAAACRELGKAAHARVTLMLPDGSVIGDSDEDPLKMENHRQRPEMAAALNGDIGRAIRFSNTLRRQLMYLAVPVEHDGRIIAVVRTAMPLQTIELTLTTVYRPLVYGAIIIAALFAVTAYYLSRRISRPLERMRQAAERMAGGELGIHLPVEFDDETGALARALNDMSSKLAQRLETIARQRNEQESVFEAMVEGVLAADADQRVLFVNRAAAGFLELPAERILGRPIQEIARNRHLQAFIAGAIRAPGAVETEILLHGRQEIHLQLRGTALQDSAGRRTGVVIVMNDITRLKRLETVRRDFVANVSHELKTPITALKGCVETLAGDGRGAPARESGKFMEMMARQVDRLQAIIEDLLSLSRIEFDAENNRIPLEYATLNGVLQRAVRTCARAAEARRTSLKIGCPPNLAAPINAPLLEEAVGNLISNAVKYSPPDSEVEINASANGATAEIRVSDNGPGIEPRHLERIFERFYRVDQARSRAMGGTGLGLAIVKHIALAHRGAVRAESVPGQGTTFIISIPRKTD